MADRQAAFVRQVGESNPAGQILLEQLDGAALLYGPQTHLGSPRRFLQPGIPLEQVAGTAFGREEFTALAAAAKT